LKTNNLKLTIDVFSKKETAEIIFSETVLDKKEFILNDIQKDLYLTFSLIAPLLKNITEQ
ncbi:MAG: hypothetical protein NC935_06110, partial [Candidatus Omnitrophica bacterium]|nr:hypothetical protein [Candidatus Omnitrophota bacterium]